MNTARGVEHTEEKVEERGSESDEEKCKACVEEEESDTEGRMDRKRMDRKGTERCPSVLGVHKA